MKFLGDRNGSLAVEMALAVPVLVALLLTGIEVSRLVLLNQKIERASATMADLVSQSEILAEGDLDNLFVATGYVVDPFDLSSNGRMIVSSIGRSGASTSVNWQRGFGAGSGTSVFGAEDGAAVFPEGFELRDGDSVIVAEAFYDYSPVFTNTVITNSTLSRYSILRPRFGSLASLLP